MIKPSLVILWALVPILNLVAQDRLLSKEEAVVKTLEGNYGILVAKNQVDIADNNQGILNSGYLPILSGSAGSNYSNAATTQEFPGRLDSLGNNIPNVALSGLESQRYNAGLNLNYTLFDGLGRFYNYKKLKEQYKLTELQARETIENTILQMFSVYFEVARLTENEKLLQQALEISQQRITRAEYSFDYGQNTKLDILNAQVDVTNDSINLMNARQQLANAKRDLNVLLNENLNENYEVDTVVTFIPKIKLEGFLQQSIANNVAVLQTERNLQINDYDIKISRSGYLPTVGLSGSYGWNRSQNPNQVFFTGQVFPGTNSSSTTFGLGASLTWNLFDGGGTRVRVNNAKINYANQELFKKQVELEVNRDIQNALAIYNNRLDIYQIQGQNVVTNINNFERSREQFQLGRITSIEFRQAQINLLNAYTNKNLAKYDAKLAELQLLQLTGQLLNIDL